uniref:Uncharacterized protein n=1 Tax=Bubo bubo TaxID=30461 RepID=A0A8C0EP87_BUBBB
GCDVASFPSPAQTSPSRRAQTSPPRRAQTSPPRRAQTSPPRRAQTSPPRRNRRLQKSTRVVTSRRRASPCPPVSRTLKETNVSPRADASQKGSYFPHYQNVS